MPIRLNAACAACASGGPVAPYLCPDSTQVSGTSSCSGFPGCVQPVLTGPSFEVVPGSGGSATVRLLVDVAAPENHQNNNSAFWPLVSWYAGATVPGTPSADTCTFGQYDKALTYIQAVASCPGGDFGTYSVQVKTCGFLTCAPPAKLEGMRFRVTPTMLGCFAPRESACNGDAACRECLGPGQSVSSTGGGPALGGGGRLGPGANLRYAAGGVGGVGLPGSTVWNPVLGRFWSHDYAERIVPDPDARHVWLLTRWATFREFTDAAGDGAYELVSPRDEYRTLSKTVAGWELTDLDGTVVRFDSSGLWLSSTDRFGNAKTATYGSGLLAAVDFPDGRRETFGYNAGRLASITEIGVDGTTSRTWTYTWSGADLIRVGRPDGTTYRFEYGAPLQRGFLGQGPWQPRVGPVLPLMDLSPLGMLWESRSSSPQVYGPLELQLLTGGEIPGAATNVRLTRSAAGCWSCA